MSIFVSQTSFSENIPNNPTCDNSTLGVYSGSAALEPDWGANTIPLRWYNNNTLMDVTTAESECEYDGSIDVATAPLRTGYTFGGWRVRPQMDFSELNASLSTNGLRRWGRGLACFYKEGVGGASTYVSCQSDGNFFELNRDEWKVEFSEGSVYGMSKCSITGGGFPPGTAGNPSDEGADNEKSFCWCKVTGWQPANNATMYGSVSTLNWRYIVAYTDNASGCRSGCASYCSAVVCEDVDLRAILFTPATNNQ